jgi:hypothetical protein
MKFSFTETHLIPLISKITNLRFFETERGYQGELVSLLNEYLKKKNLFPKEFIVEQEHQKSVKHHNIRQRPDIIIHVPIEAGLTKDRAKNNFLVIALKRKGDAKSIIGDFEKLDEMFGELNYPEGVIININTQSKFVEFYQGKFPDRLHELAIKIKDDAIYIIHSSLKNGKVKSITHEYACP